MVEIKLDPGEILALLLYLDLGTIILLVALIVAVGRKGGS